MISRELKNFFANYQIATQTFNKKTIEKSLSNYFTKESLFNFCHPFGTFKGLNNFLSKCILPLLDSIPDLERRDMIIICLLYTSPSPRDLVISRMPSSA